MSNMVSGLIEEDNSDTVIEVPIPNVSSKVLEKVIEFCTHYQKEPMMAVSTPLKSSKIEDIVQPWYVNFVTLDQAMLFELVTAANYMDIKPLLDLTCLAVAVYIKGKSAEELRSIFNLSDDFTPEEEAQLREENNWNEPAQP